MKELTWSEYILETSRIFKFAEIGVYLTPCSQPYRSPGLLFSVVGKFVAGW